MSRIISLVAAATIALSATAAIAGPEAPQGEQRFVRDGRTFIYRTQPTGGGTLISGYSLPGNSRFSLVVRNGRVTGHSGGTPVSFKTSAAAGAASASLVTVGN